MLFPKSIPPPPAPDFVQVAKTRTADLVGWRVTRERALTIYWGRRKEGATENEALCSVLDDCLRDDADA